jgi:hypothetical protein
MKKLGLLTSLISLISLTNVSGASASTFTDVSTTSPYITYIHDLGRLGVTDGVAPGLFAPTQTVTRAQFAKFVSVAFQISDDGSSVPFLDISNHWSAPYVRAAYQAGIIDGTSATTFSPEQPVKREEAAAMIWRLAQSKGVASEATLPFVDAPDAWAISAVSGVLANGWYAADTSKSGEKWVYRPRDTMTRQEMAALLDLSMQELPGSIWTPASQDTETTEEPTMQSWQESLKEHMLNQETDFQITIDNSSEFKQIKGYVDALLAEQDYLHYIYKSMSYEYDGISKTTFTIAYLESKAQTDYVSQQAKTIVSSIITPSMNVYEKEKAIHDYVVSHLAYDLTLIEHSAYGGLTKGSTVCQGYALLTYRLLTEAGIENKIVEGRAGGQLHTWNLVNLAGNWYHLDTTWDDPVPDVKGKLTYKYFNLTDAQIKRDHTWTGSDYPATSTDFIQKINQEVQLGTIDAAGSQALLTSTGLSSETAENKADSISAAQAILQRGLSAHQNAIIFNFKSSLGSAQTVMKSALTNSLMLSNNVGNVTYEYGASTRLTGYTTVTVNVTYGS